MGGFGSGRWQHGKNTTDDYRRLDVRELQRDNLLVPGQAFNLRWTRNGIKIASINVKTEPEQLTLSYRQQRAGDEWKSENYPVRVEWTDCNYGGQRPWFICPMGGCERRVAILYGSAIFACRHCLRLAYACQRENIHDRALRRADKIRARLGWKPGILNKMQGIPKGMHWYTFERLIILHHPILEATLRLMAKQIGMKIEI